MKKGTNQLLSFRLLITLVLVCNLSYAQSYKIRVAMMGNSITYGARLDNPATESYPALLSNMLSEIYGDTIEVKKFAVSGRTMMKSAESPLWNESIFKDALEYVPDVCLIFLGTNDSKPYRWEAWGDEFLDDYMAMIDTFKFRNPYTKFIACYPPPIWEGHPYGTNFNDSHNDSIVVNCVIPAIDTVVEKTGALLIDFHTPFLDSLHLFPDKLHPNATGAKYMAEILYDSIIATNFFEDIETGKAYISTFEPATSKIPQGGTTELKWTTFFADSVFLNGVPVEKEGKKEIIADSATTYILTAKSNKNTVSFPLKLNTYIPVKSRITLSTSSTSYQNGKEVTFYAVFKDQNNKIIRSTNNNIKWEILEGEGTFGTQNDTSIIFTPGAIRKIIIKASEGEIYGQKIIYSNTDPYLSVENESSNGAISVFPNPANTTINFKINSIQSSKVEIQISDLMGKLITSRNFNNNTNSLFNLNISNLIPGIYLYVIKYDNITARGRFKKESGKSE